MEKVIIECESFGDEAGWVAYVPSMPGMVEQGETLDKALEKLATSLKVKRLYELAKGINLN